VCDPFWFQALGAVMGMDWHSSGITTSVMNALKNGLNPTSKEPGVYIGGGRTVFDDTPRTNRVFRPRMGQLELFHD
jgi:uncharacterized protein